MRENGEPIRSVTDKDGLIERSAADAPELRLLRYVDAYGDTYFNKLQMADLKADWQVARTLIETANDAECWDVVQGIINECLDRTHLYVKFVGD
jgi:hypothetical protein